eukprot:s935_g20.t1
MRKRQAQRRAAERAKACLAFARAVTAPPPFSSTACHIGEMKVFHRDVSLVACLAEFVGMTLFVIIGCGSAMGIQGSGSSGGSGGDGDSTSGETTSMIPGWVLMVALVFGLSITTLAYSIGHYSGGLKWNWWNALIGELVGTFLLVFVVLQTACNPKSSMNRSQACLAIGLAVFMAHCVLIPIDGCSINPTRSFGPALLSLSRMEAPKAVEPVATMVGEPALGEVAPKAVQDEDAAAGPGYWRSMWIFWVGPLLGACLAAAVYKGMLMLDAVHEEHTLKHHPGYKRRQTLIEHGTTFSTSTPADPEAATGPVLLGSKHGQGQREGKDAAARAESSA